jgi:hypothetical protein
VVQEDSAVRDQDVLIKEGIEKCGVDVLFFP